MPKSKQMENYIYKKTINNLIIYCFFSSKILISSIYILMDKFIHYDISRTFGGEYMPE